MRYKPGSFYEKIYQVVTLGQWTTQQTVFIKCPPPQLMVTYTVSNAMLVNPVEIAFGFVLKSSKPVLIPDNVIKTH